jgi:hypothetical protein
MARYALGLNPQRVFHQQRLIRLFEFLKNSHCLSTANQKNQTTPSQHFLDTLVCTEQTSRQQPRDNRSSFTAHLIPRIHLFNLTSVVAALAAIGASRWWRMTGSNRRPPACKAGALPAELIPHELFFARVACVVGLVGFEPTTPALSRRCSNRLSYRPTRLSRLP